MKFTQADLKGKRRAVYLNMYTRRLLPPAKVVANGVIEVETVLVSLSGTGRQTSSETCSCFLCPCQFHYIFCCTSPGAGEAEVASPT